MSGSEPYKFDSDFDRISDYRTTSMLTVPMTNQQGKVLGVMQIINAKDADGNIIPFSRSDESLIKHFATSAALAIERAQMTRYVLMRMISMAEMRDPSETGAHVNRVASYSVEIYEQWAWKNATPVKEVERQKDTLRMAAMLHDVGKVAISDLILKKPGRLTDDEFEQMKMHTSLGAKLFKEPQSDFEELASLIALTHHEKWDGTGYPGVEGPDGKITPLKGEEIPIFGRITAIADVYDALSSSRCYKEAWEEDRVHEEMHRSSGTHFDPEVLDAFFSRIDVIKSIAERYPEEKNS
jgi:response regulator RpfG family c-di-GMP phosphodiesterase